MTLLLWILFVAVGGILGSKKGQPVGGIIVSFLLGPIGWLIILATKDVRMKCPQCRGLIEKEAAICPHCRSALSQMPQSDPRPMHGVPKGKVFVPRHP